MKEWLKKFDDAMAAAAFAEEGEFETARETLRGQGKILLALTGEKSDEKAFRYAINMSKRIGADLLILYSGSARENLVGPFQSDLRKEKIGYQKIRVEGCIKEAILKSTSKRLDILFVVIKSSHGLNFNCRKSEKQLSNAWNNLKCPLVVVSDLSMA